MKRPRSPIEIMIDRACGYNPDAVEVYREDPPVRMPVMCCCGRPFKARRVCADERRIKNPCRCACHAAENVEFKRQYDAEIAALRPAAEKEV